ncbi:MAG: DUF3343 domain-containing protein [Clostridiales bacterium]|nr:DUF3343 domain-containing protein [Clostridiales bacterium]MDY4895541.1 DUF3343 domain-containing protein [Christensenellaceae bacterium]HAC10697.1 hypothetical protein [Clostridiales bacterium]
MTTCAVFRSRSQALSFASRLSASGVRVSVVPAPKEAGIGCGLCVKFSSRDYSKARTILSMYGYDSFRGFFG